MTNMLIAAAGRIPPFSLLPLDSLTMKGGRGACALTSKGHARLDDVVSNWQQIDVLIALLISWQLLHTLPVVCQRWVVFSSEHLAHNK